MEADIQVLFIITLILVCIDVIIICRLIIRKSRNKKVSITSEYYYNTLIKAVLGYETNIKKKIPISDYLKMKQSVQLNEVERERVHKVIDINKVEKLYFKRINSIFRTNRIEAIIYLGTIKTEKARLVLENKLIKEKDITVKLYIAIALNDIFNKESISALISSLQNANRFYRDKVNMLIAEFGEDFNSFLPKIIRTDKIEVKELIVDFASVYFSDILKGFLVDLIDNKDIEIRRIQRFYEMKSSRKKFISSKKDEEKYLKLVYKACDILVQYYPSELNAKKYLNSEDINIKNMAISSLSDLNSKENINKLLLFLKDENTSRSAINAISKIIERNPDYINIVVNSFNKDKDQKVKEKLAKILSKRIEYFIMNLSGNNKEASAEIIKEILLQGRTSEVIDFLNKNKDMDIQKKLVVIIREVISKTNKYNIEFSRYLNVSILSKCGLSPLKEEKQIKNEKKDKKLIVNVYLVLFISIIIFPCVYLLSNMRTIYYLNIYQHIKNFVVEFNYYIAYYVLTISSIYFILLVLSYLNVRKQVRLWNIKSSSLLFKKNVLPSVSIIAPAYNEEKTIIESANSLLNLKYPDYELIIVNDGSNDNTLERLIKYFNLIRVNNIYEYKLNTKLVRGVFINPSRPKLIVVDKYNGGKADSLNTGINISSKEYICGIDADSILEEDALLKLASLTLDSGMETPALGGNIFPINGCIVENGYIKDKHIPKSNLGRFQTIEYIRAFMAGRLGWAYVNSLLLISGAFGLFRKERVISVGGYLTSSGKFEKDTVGEDMELVVRISRFMKEKDIIHKICYGFNANCWTEVPEDIKTLKNQRYRWHKGLIDILNFHKKMICNPEYGRIGIFAMSYFFIFEVIGPIIEIQGMIMVILAIMLGLMNMKIALILFIVTILIGMIISTTSLIIAEIDLENFSMKDLLILIVYAIIENFGPRQFFSIWRVSALFKVLKKPVGWQKAQRKGFVSQDINFKKGISKGRP